MKKSAKNKIQKALMWPKSGKDPKGREMTPDAVVERVKSFSDEDLKRLYKPDEIKKGFDGSPRQLQLNAIKKEIKRRGLEESNNSTMENNDYSKESLVKSGEECDKKEKKIDYEEDEQKNICKICGKKFETADRLDDHLGEHY